MTYKEEIITAIKYIEESFIFLLEYCLNCNKIPVKMIVPSIASIKFGTENTNIWNNSGNSFSKTQGLK